MINLSLLKQRALRLIQGRTTFKDACDREWIVCPPEEQPSRPAIFFEEDLAKVKGVSEGATYAGEIGRLDVGMKIQGATIAYQLSNVEIYHGYVYKGAMKYPFVDAKETFISNKETTYLSKALIASNIYTCRYFGHWVTEALPLELAAQQLGVAAVTPAQTFYKHQSDYHKLVGVCPVPVNKAKCAQLTILDDIAPNKFKRDRYLHIRSQISSQLKPLYSNHGVMFLRKASGNKRVLVNEMEVANFLESQGFVIIDAEAMTAVDVMRHVLGAKVVVGVEGSQITPAIYAMSDTGTMLALQPPDRFRTCHKEYTDCLEMNYSFLVCDQVPNGFKVNLDTLARLLDKIGY